MAGVKGGYVFRGVTRHARHARIARNGLSAQWVRLVVKAAVARVGGGFKKVSGPYERVGCDSYRLKEAAARLAINPEAS